jgi:putative transposase
MYKTWTHFNRRLANIVGHAARVHLRSLNRRIRLTHASRVLHECRGKNDATRIFTRRCLPHWYVPGAAFFVTYRLFDTLPAEARERLRMRREQLLREKAAPGTTLVERRRRAHKLWFAEYDGYLDGNRRKPWLADAGVGSIVRSNLYHHHGRKYHLMAYCVMPNHVHVVLQPIEVREQLSISRNQDHVGERDDGISPLSKIMHSLKSYTAHEANKQMDRSGAFWQRESYDHWIRDEEELERIVNYIQANPVTAGLVQRPQDWLFCSCRDRFLSDGEVTAWLDWSRRDHVVHAARGPLA